MRWIIEGGWGGGELPTNVSSPIEQRRWAGDSSVAISMATRMPAYNSFTTIHLNKFYALQGCIQFQCRAVLALEHGTGGPHLFNIKQTDDDDCVEWNEWTGSVAMHLKIFLFAFPFVCDNLPRSRHLPLHWFVLIHFFFSIQVTCGNLIRNNSIFA